MKNFKLIYKVEAVETNSWVGSKPTNASATVSCVINTTTNTIHSAWKSTHAAKQAAEDLNRAINACKRAA